MERYVMEYRKRCNVCGNIFCYTDQDVSNNRSANLMSALSSFGAAAGAFTGNWGATIANQSLSQNNENKVVDFDHCPRCRSMDLRLMTDSEWSKYQSSINQSMGQTKQININSNASKEALIRRITLFLEDGDWNSAEAYCNQVLDMDPECGEAYLLLLYAHNEISGDSDAINKEFRILNSNESNRVTRFASSELMERINQIEYSICERKYQRGIQKLRQAASIKDFSYVVHTMNEINGYKDSAQVIEFAKQKQDECRSIENKKAADRNIRVIKDKKSSIEEIKKASNELREINSFEYDKEIRVAEHTIKNKNSQKVVKVVLSVIIAAIFVIILVKSPQIIKYNNAKKSMKNSNYSEARDAFDKLGNFCDAKSYYEVCSIMEGLSNDYVISFDEVYSALNNCPNGFDKSLISENVIIKNYEYLIGTWNGKLTGIGGYSYDEDEETTFIIKDGNMYNTIGSSLSTFGDPIRYEDGVYYGDSVGSDRDYYISQYNGAGDNAINITIKGIGSDMEYSLIKE